MFASFSLGTCLSNTQADALRRLRPRPRLRKRVRSSLNLDLDLGLPARCGHVHSGRFMTTRVVYLLLMLCLSWTSVAWSAEEGEAVERAIKEAAMAASTFSETRNKQAVLKLYTKDYV